MLRALRHRLPPFARIALALLLACATLAAPVLSFAAQAHESLAHPGEHADVHADDHAHADDAIGADADDDDDGSLDTLHVVMHLSTCCGHACALLPTAWVPVDLTGSDHPGACVDRTAPSRAPEHLLRPPITA